MSSTTEPAAPAIAHVKRRLVPDDLNSTTTFRWTPPEASSWGKAKLAAWDSLSTAPDAYYTSYLAPGERPAHGDWTAAELDELGRIAHEHFEKVYSGAWGLLSLHLPGRTGLQCKQAYEAIRISGGPREDATPIGRAARRAASRAAVAIRASKGGAQPRADGHSPTYSEKPTVGQLPTPALSDATTAKIGPLRNKPITVAAPPGYAAPLKGGESPLVGATLRFCEDGAPAYTTAVGTVHTTFVASAHTTGTDGATLKGSIGITASEQGGEAKEEAKRDAPTPSADATAPTVTMGDPIPGGGSAAGHARCVAKGDAPGGALPGLPAGGPAEPPCTPLASAPPLRPADAAPSSPVASSPSAAAHVLASMAGPPAVFPPAQAAPASVAPAAAQLPPSSVLSKRSAPATENPTAYAGLAPATAQVQAAGAKRHKARIDTAPDESMDVSANESMDPSKDMPMDASMDASVDMSGAEADAAMDAAAAAADVAADAALDADMDALPLPDPSDSAPLPMPPPAARLPPPPPHSFDREPRPADRKTVARLLAGMLQGAARPPSPPVHALLDPSPDRLRGDGQHGKGTPGNTAGVALPTGSSTAPDATAGAGGPTPQPVPRPPRPSIALSPAQAIGLQASALAELRLQRRWLNHLFEQELSRLDTPARGQSGVDSDGAASLNRARQAVADKFKRLRADLLAREELQLQSMEAMRQWEATARGRRGLNSAAPPPRFAVYGPPPDMPTPMRP